MSRAFVSIACVAVIVCGCGSSAVEQREVTAGQFHGLVIGMTRAQVMVAARNLGANVLSATPCRQFAVTASNANELPSLTELEGVRLTDLQKNYEAIFFKNGMVSRLTHSPDVELLSNSVVAGDDLADVRDRLLAFVRAHMGSVVIPIADVEDSGLVQIRATGVIEPNLLDSHACWLFEIASVSPAGATYEVDFGPMGLRKVLYRRPRIRVE